jgi:2-amino-4-hydroxy-6-hydroxymethyldihydropteridine diphosphokinase
LKTAYLALGSNLGDREAHIREALRLLEEAEVRPLRVSSFYETEPRDLRSQPWFLNIAAAVETRLFPMQLLARIQMIERVLGRKRLVAKGPRTIDIDILLYGNFVVKTEALEIPHPRMAERRFVLEPLAEIAPDLRHPELRKTIRELAAQVAGQVVKRRSDKSDEPMTPPV